MRNKWFIAGLMLVIAGAAYAAKPKGEVVIVGSPTQGQAVTVADVEADQAFDTLWGNQADLVKFALPPTMVPRSSCDDAEDCARTVKDTCRIIDPTGATSGVTVSYNGQEGTCSGTCDDGRAVSVVCVS